MPSTVFTDLPLHARPSTRQDSTGTPSTSTAQVPHSPSSQPCLVPVSPRSSRSTSSSVLCGANDTSQGSAFSVKLIEAFASGMSSKLTLPFMRRSATFRATAHRNRAVLVRSTLVLIFCSCAVALRAYAQAGAAPDYRTQAIQILRTVPLLDGHNDIPD